MKNPQSHSVLKGATASSLTLGIAMVATSGNGFLGAQLTGGGATAAVPAIDQTAMLKQAVALHGAAPEVIRNSLETQILIGMLFILMGFCLHLLWLQKHKQLAIRVRSVYAKRSAWYRMRLWIDERLDQALHAR